MTTNGILIDDDIIKKMKETEMYTISISLDGIEKTHDEFRGVKGSYNKIINNIRRLKDENFIKYIQVTTVINKTNINELDELYKNISELNINSWRIVSMDPIGRAQDNKQLDLDEKEIIILLDFIKGLRKNAGFDITYGCSHFLGEKYERELRKHMFFCVSGYTTASILYNGDIYVCPNVERVPELIQGNIRTEDFIDVWENKFKWFRNEDRLKNDKCSKCSDWKYCKGDSLHTWDFKNKKPKVCFKNILEGVK
jgi:radical SAM protein with 4Fe4S-binding SPASM domain